jgi:hypothetical protein
MMRDVCERGYGLFICDRLTVWPPHPTCAVDLFLPARTCTSVYNRGFMALFSGRRAGASWPASRVVSANFFRPETKQLRKGPQSADARKIHFERDKFCILACGATVSM